MKRIPNIQFAENFFMRFWGVMGKTKWPKGWGGICFPRCCSLHTFFTYLSPDIVFLDKDRKILKIIPLTGSWRIIWGPAGCRHSLELPGGTAKKLNLKKGNRFPIKKF